MSDYIFYYKYRTEIFGVIEEVDDEYKVESIESRKTYDIGKQWITDEIKKGNLELSEKGLFD